MTEEAIWPPPSPNEVGMLRRLLTWAGVGLRWSLVSILVLLLLGCFLFHAPIKAALLLASITGLLVLTPRRFRIYVFTPIFVIFAAVAIWVFLPEDNSRWKPLHLRAEIDAFNARYAVQDNENSAPIYLKLCEDMNDAIPPNRSLFAYGGDGRWFYDPEPNDVQRWWQKNSSNLTPRLKEGLDRRGFFVPLVPFNGTGNVNITRAAMLRPLAVCIARQAESLAGAGQFDESLSLFGLTGGITDHLMQQPDDMVLVSLMIEAYTSPRYRTVILRYNIPPESLISFARWEEQRAIEAQNIATSAHTVYTRLRLRDTLASLYEEDGRGHIRLSGKLGTSWNLVFSNLRPDKTPTWKVKVSRICMRLLLPSDSNVLFDDFDTAFDTCEKRYSAGLGYKPFLQYDGRNATTLDVKHHLWGLMDLAWPVEYAIRDATLSCQANHRANLIAMALRRYKDEKGQWPAWLDEGIGIESWVLNDPINGGTFVYKRTQDGFMLYSKGKNGIDDGGWQGYHNGKDCDDIRFWPLRMTEATESTQNDRQ